MYKKIKNGSFMNWIWFFICIAPILLIFIYSLSFFDNEEKKILINEEIENQTQNLLINKLGNIEDGTIIIENNYSFKTIANDEYPLYSFNFELNGTYIIYLIAISNNLDSSNPFILTTENEQFYYELNSNENFAKHTITLSGQDKLYLTLNGSNSNFAYYITNSTYNFTYEDFIENNNYEKISYITYNQVEKSIYSNYEDYLAMFENTLKTNGFIANTFLNLSTYFNVSNVYYSLRAYYVEYLLIMILLHLAFDILYILPNICHKFMEKIGGERD